MAHPLTLPTVAMLALAGTGLGVYLGRAAVDEINPLYFSLPEATRSYAALTPNRGDDFDALRPREVAATEYGAALGRGCVGCRTYPEEYFPRRDPAVDAQLERSWSDEEPAVQQAVQQLPQFAAARSEEQRLIEAYSRYPVDEEEMRRHERALEVVVEPVAEAQAEAEPVPVGL
jgi:hypothetical protein